MNHQPGSNWNNPANNGIGVTTPPDNSHLLLSERPTLMGPGGSSGASTKVQRDPGLQVRKGFAVLCAAGVTIYLLMQLTATPTYPVVSPVVYVHTSPIYTPGNFRQPAPRVTMQTAPLHYILNHSNLPVKEGKLLTVLMSLPTSTSGSNRHADLWSTLAVSPDGKLLAMGVAPGGVAVWETSTGKLVRTLDDCTIHVSSLLFTPDSQTLIIGRRDEIIKFWSLKNGGISHVLAAHMFGLTSMALSADGKTLVSAGRWDSSRGRASEVKLWDVATGTLKKTLSSNELVVTALAFAPDGSRLAGSAGTSSDPSELVIWDLHSKAPPVRRSEAYTWIYGVAFSPDSKKLASAGINMEYQTGIVADEAEESHRHHSGAVTERDCRTGEPLQKIQCHAQVTEVAYRKDGKTLAAAGAEPRVERINPNNELPELCYSPCYDLTSGVLVHGNLELSLMATCSNDGPVQIFSID